MWLDTVLDVVGVVWDIIDIVATPANPLAWAALAADVGCIFIPGATGAGKLIKGAGAAADFVKTAKAVGKLDELVDAIKAGQRIFGSYRELEKATKIAKCGLEAHHLIPKALLSDLQRIGFKGSVGDMLSVILDSQTHRGVGNVITKGWNNAIAAARRYGIEINKEWLLSTAELVYKDMPDLLAVTKEWIQANF